MIRIVVATGGAAITILVLFLIWRERKGWW